MCHIRLNDETKTDVVVKYLWVSLFCGMSQTLNIYYWPQTTTHSIINWHTKKIGLNLFAQTTLNDVFDNSEWTLTEQAHLHLSPHKPFACIYTEAI